MILYIHGFNSSPASHKSNQLREYLRRTRPGTVFSCPALSHWPAQAIRTLESEVRRAGTEGVTLVGSSLGGFYATWLVERFDCRAVLVNPAITPQEGLRAYLGPQRNLYTQEQYTLTEEHLQQLAALYVPGLRRVDRYLLLQTTGDEVLDWRKAVARYEGCRQIVIHGSDHGFKEFEQYLEIVALFARV
ncbi:MAG TPA: YqiA/YcfP family alpha/beta fold hydrolase [Burkholderiales bacterium]|jgi:predicted esterase YcpF (UPF0227 family)|nr:YqiA/YcfP family alpha/beta fold hydrolase [Burkholderiales bacterium]